MIDFELLALDLGPDPNIQTEKPDPVVSDEAEAINGSADEYHREEGFEVVADLPEIEDSADIEDQELPEPLEIVKGMIHQGTKVVLGGGSKSFKTWSLLDLAHSVAYGRPWMGHECVPGRVLYINMEILKVFFNKRVKKVREAKGIEKLHERLDVWNLRGKSAGYRIIIPQIIRKIKERGYVLVIIDPIYKVYGTTDENSASEVGQLLNELERVCVETHAAIAFGAHYSKGNQAGKESIDRISGSGVFARDPDTIIPFTRHEEDNCFVIEPTLRNLAPIEPFVVRWSYPLMQRDDDLDPASLKQVGGGRKKEHDPIDILSAIRSNTKDNPISISEWAEKCGLKRQTLQTYVEALRNDGFIATIGEGSHARKYVTEKGLKKLL